MEAGQAAPRDNVVFEAGLFGGTLGMRRTFILHANGAKLPSDLLGLTCVRYSEATRGEAEIKINQKLRKAIESEGRLARIEGVWWQFSLTERSIREPSAISLLRVSRDRDGALEVVGRAWQENGSLSARYWSEASKEKRGASGHLLLLEGREGLGDPNAPQLEGTGGDPDRVGRSCGGVLDNSFGNCSRTFIARTSGVYLRADPEDMSIMDGRDDQSARRVARGTAEALEVDLERLRLAHARPREKRAGGIVQPKAKINVSPVAHHYFRTRDAIRDSAEAPAGIEGSAEFVEVDD